MKNRNAAAMVLVLVLGGSLVALRLTGDGRAPAPSPTPAEQPPIARPAAPPPPPPMLADPSRAAVSPRDAGSGKIDGIVISGVTRQGIPDAELVFVGEAGVSTFRTGRDGHFDITPAGTGSFTLASITAPGFLPYSSHAPPVGFSAGSVTLVRGRAVHGVTLLLYPAVDYDGIVVDARDAPIRAARVRLQGPPGESVLESPPEWTTGADGRFTFQAADGAVLEASHGGLRGWAHVDRSVVIMKKLTIHLGYAPPRDATITGRVRDSAGAPLADASVRAVPSAYYSLAPTVVATTAGDGRFTLAGVERVAYDLSAEAEDHLPAVQANVRGGTQHLELTLDRGLMVAGQVIDQHGDPVPSFTLVVQQVVGLARDRVATLSLIDPRGRFAVRVGPGDHELIASAPGQPPTAVLAPAGATDVQIVIGSGTSLRGRVRTRDGGTPIPEASVRPQLASTSQKAPSVLPVAVTGSDGTFELVGLAPGPLAIEVHALGYDTAIEELPAAGSDHVRDPVTIDLSRNDLDRRRGNLTSGIGVQVFGEGSALRVVGVLPHSGAHDAGLTENDRIIAVDDVPVATLGVADAIDRIRGPAGTSVTLTLRRQGQDTRLMVERRELRS